MLIIPFKERCFNENILEDTENNLLRVNDIVQEVKRQIASIERQANRARRYKEVFEQLKELEIKIANYEINELINTSVSLASEKETLKQKISEGYANLNTLYEKINLAQKELEEINEQKLNLNNELINSRNLIERNTQHGRSDVRSGRL